MHPLRHTDAAPLPRGNTHAVPFARGHTLLTWANSASPVGVAWKRTAHLTISASRPSGVAKVSGAERNSETLGVDSSFCAAIISSPSFVPLYALYKVVNAASSAGLRAGTDSSTLPHVAFLSAVYSASRAAHCGELHGFGGGGRAASGAAVAVALMLMSTTAAMLLMAIILL